jgi:hypothetical protein
MRRPIIAGIIATALMLTGLTPGPLRATALGETSVTLTCSDNTSLTLLVGADTLAGLTAAVQAMIDYPAGLSCTLVQNPLPLTVFFGHVAAAANPNTLVVAGGRWLAPCSLFVGFETSIPGGVMARGGPRPALAKVRQAPLLSTPCPVDPANGCVWVNIGVNLHFRDKTDILEGTLNETIPENQFCPNVNGGTTSIGPSHFTSKPTPTSCLFVADKRALTTTYVTQVFGPGFTTLLPGGGLSVDAAVHFRFRDLGNPSQATDQLSGPPAFEASDCDTRTDSSAPLYPLENGNINVYGAT